MEFNQQIKQNLDGEGFLTESDKKIDVIPDNEEEKATQDKVAEEMKKSSPDDINADTSGDTSEDEDEDLSDEDKETSEEEDEEFGEDKPPKDESDDKLDDETPPLAEPAEDESKKSENNAKIQEIENSSLSDAEKQKQIFLQFCDNNSDVMTPEIKENYLKYYSTGNNAFLHMDNKLHKFSEALGSFRNDIPFTKKLDMAFNIAFNSEIAKKEQKKGEIKTEIRMQKVNKAVSSPTGSTGKPTASKYTKGQIWAAEKMGVKLI